MNENEIDICEGCCHKEYKGNYPPYDFSWETPCPDCPYLKKCATCQRLEFRESINRYEGNHYWCPVKHIKILLSTCACSVHIQGDKK